MGFKQMLISMLADGADGSISSKRVVTTLAFAMCSAGFIANMFWGLTVQQFMYDSMMYIVIAGMGIVGAEKFAPKAKT